MNYKVRIIENRAIEIEVQAESEGEAIDTAQDAYMNNDTLQEQMLQDSAIIGDGVKVVEKDGYRIDDDGYLVIPQTLKIKKDELAKWETMLHSDNIDYGKEGFSEEECVMKWTAKFADGREIDLKVCTNRREDRNLWSEAVLFDANSMRLAYSEVCDVLSGEWSLLDGNLKKHYILNVVAE